MCPIKNKKIKKDLKTFNIKALSCSETKYPFGSAFADSRLRFFPFFFFLLHVLTFQQFFIKNGSHGTIHIFKNYFATIFSVLAK